jgi:cbb3-type cytochrome oxidase maturation protein
MNVLVYLIPAALFLGMVGLAAFFWAVKSRQFDDMDGAAMRILIDDADGSEGEESESNASNGSTGA